MGKSAARKNRGFTLIEMIIVVAIIGVLFSIAVPQFINMRAKVQKDTCVNNLRQIKLAKETWALEKNKVSTDEPEAVDLDTYIKGGTTSLRCPLDLGNSFATSYTVNDIGTDPICIISADHRL